MYAITVMQPWAALIAEGWKTIEVRSHNKYYRVEGKEIAIHAGKKWDNSVFDCPSEWLSDSKKKYILEKYGADYDQKDMGNIYEDGELQKEATISKTETVQHEGTRTKKYRGNVLCTAKVELIHLLSEKNSAAALVPITGVMTWGLFLTDIKKLPEPVPEKGKQGLWIWSESV